MVDPGLVERFRTGLLSWAETNTRNFPWREPDASFYEVFMAELFLRRTRADTVESFLPDFLEQYPSVAALRDAEHAELASVIRPMGLQNKRAQALLDLAAEIDGSELPRDRELLLELPEVGPYIANATLCFTLDAQLPIVDRNFDRVYGRVFGEVWEDRNETERYAFAADVLPNGDARQYNLGLLDFASLVCTPSEPDCESCFAKDYCHYYQNIRTDVT